MNNDDRMMKITLYFLLISFNAFTASSLDKQPSKRSYACPPNFVRLSHRCYFFSKEKATWHDAFFQCHSMHSHLAIIKNANQDRLIRKTLNKKTLEPLERWLGGRFDWHRKQWKWAASGKPLTFKGFDKSVNLESNDTLQWSCIITDPRLEYRWNAKSCLEEKHFICHKKIFTITNNKSRTKLLEQYKTNKLNEIPIPEVSNDIERTFDTLKRQLQTSKPSLFNVETLPTTYQNHELNKKKKKKKRKSRPLHVVRPFSNGTFNENSGPLVMMNDQALRRRTKKAKADGSKENNVEMYYKTYKENGKRKHPLHPIPIVEEYNFVNKVS